MGWSKGYALRLTGTMACLALIGCYASHDDGEPTPPRADGGAMRADDAGPSPVADASVPDPPAPDPDLGPDSRPSDYPDASDWGDPPPRADDEPCCVLSAARQVTTRSDGVALAHEAPVVAWGPSVWGLFATRQVELPGEVTTTATFLQVAADGSPLGPPTDVGEIGLRRATAAFAEGRWALMYAAGSLELGHVFGVAVQLFDGRLRPASPILGASGAGDHDALALARMTVGDRWYAFNATHDSEALRVTPFSDSGVETFPYIELDTGPRFAVRAVGMRSRVALLSALQTGQVVAHVLSPPPEYAISAPIDLGLSGRSIALAAIGDRAAAVSISEEGEVRARVFDPFASAAIETPAVSIARLTQVERQSVDAAGSSKFGLVGVCIADGSREGPSRIEFVTVDREGRRYGAAVEVMSGPFRGGITNCTVGSDGRGFLVAWWDGSALWVRRVDIPER